MIISHKHKFIFIKPQKTAGTSVELLLSRICGPEDVITPLGFDPDPNVRKKHQAKPAQNFKRARKLNHWTLGELFWFVFRGRKPHSNYWEHLDAATIRQYVGEEVWKSYTKISIVRNPWDHAVSQFYWMKRYGFQNTKDDFNDFLFRVYKPQWPFLNSRGILDMDYVLRFENLESDLNQVLLIMKIQDPNLTLPKTKASIRKNKSYKENYDDHSKEIVRKRNLQILESFNYEY